MPLGSEAHWPRWLTGLGNAPAVLPLFARDFLRYMAFWPAAGPAYRVADYDVETDPARLAPQAETYNAATYDPAAGTVRLAGDLGAFRRAGGKLVLYHGLADPLVTPGMTVAFHDALARQAADRRLSPRPRGCSWCRAWTIAASAPTVRASPIPASTR